MIESFNTPAMYVAMNAKHFEESLIGAVILISRHYNTELTAKRFDILACSSKLSVRYSRLKMALSGLLSILIKQTCVCVICAGVCH